MVISTDKTDNVKVRLSPSASATLYVEGTKRKGNDGNIWIVKIASNGVHRWQLHRKPTTIKTISKSNSKSKSKSKSMSKSKSKTIYINNFNKFKRIGEFDASSGLSTGESFIIPIDILMSGVYIAYNVDQMLLIAHESVDEITPNILSNLKFKDSNLNMHIEYGLQTFYDLNTMKTISKFGYKEHGYQGNKKKNYIPMIEPMNISKMNYRKGFIITTDNIHDMKDDTGDYIDYSEIIDYNLPFGVMLANDNGAGLYPLYVSGNKIAIIGSNQLSI
jgi:hypothetical protein